MHPTVQLHRKHSPLKGRRFETKERV